MCENDYTVNFEDLFIIPGLEINYHIITCLLELIFKINNCEKLSTAIYIYLFYVHQKSSRKNADWLQDQQSANLYIFCNLKAYISFFSLWLQWKLYLKNSYSPFQIAIKCVVWHNFLFNLFRRWQHQVHLFVSFSSYFILFRYHCTRFLCYILQRVFETW